MALTSPGSQITIVDESQYLPAAAGPRPLIIAPSAQNKVNASGTGVATGTLAANAGKVQLVASQRDLATQFGVPSFPVVNGAVQQGSELNEYGLLAAYSFLGVASTAYILRPDIDTSQLVASASAPTGAETTGTYWLDLASSSWGLLGWNSTDQAFSAIAPTLITDSANISGGLPKASFGKAGDYAVYVNTSTKKIEAFYKGARTDLSQNWSLLGSNAWKQASATLTTASIASFTSGTLVVNGQSITSGTTPSALAAAINANLTLIAYLKAFVAGNSVVIYSSQDVIIGGGSTAQLLTDLGLTAKTYGCPALQQSKHTVVPPFKTSDTTPRPTGSVWFKTTSPNSGANIVVKRMSAAGEWVTVPCPLYSAGTTAGNDDNDAAIAALASDGVTASTIAANSLYMRYNEFLSIDNQFVCSIEQWVPSVPLSVTGTVANPTFVDGNGFQVVAAGVTYAVSLNVALGDTLNADGLAAAFSRTNIPNMQMSVTTAGTITISHLTGNDFALTDGTGTPLATAGITVGLYSNWTDLSYSASTYEPRIVPATGTLWYSSVVDQVDIMVNTGSGWAGYKTTYPLTDPAGVLVSATQPETQSDATALVTNDLWLDTSDLENYPVLRRYTSAGAWELIDNTDQTTDAGILFADARSRVGGASTDSSAIADLLTSSYLDLDAPDYAEYPKGMLLFNLRRSGYNVKEYKVNYFNATDFPSMSLPSFKDSWVSKVTTAGNGAPYMGRKAQRRVIVVAMQAALTSSLEARQEQNDFNLIAAPGYPELADEMVGLNTDRKGTAFILVDPPFRLQPTAAAVKAWATNSNGALTDGEDGLATLDDYAAVWYPNGYATELLGNNVMVPASHIMLRTIALNDQVAFPWFAPAGLRRGVVNNATSVGYLSSEGEFVPAPVGQGERDVMYENRVNPIVIQPTGGIVVMGQKTLAITASALDRVNVARLVVYVRSQLDRLVKPYLFEPNDTLTRNQVKQSIESFFNELVGQRALYDFLVVCDSSNNTPDRIDRNELWVDIAIKPVKAIEFIYIPIRIVNTGASLG